MKEDLSIRNGRPEDDLRCGQIIAAAWMASEVPGRLPHAVEMFDNGAPLPTGDRQRLIVELPNFIVGFTDFDVSHNHVWHLFVDPDLQGLGAGRALLHEAQQIMGGKMSLQCLSAAGKSLAWYQTQGFQITGTHRGPLCGRDVNWTRLRRRINRK